MKNICKFILLVIFILLISACSGDDTNNYDYDEETLNEETLNSEDKEEIINLTTRVLTVETSADFRTLLQSATEALNADWNERGYPYILELDLQVHPIPTRETTGVVDGVVHMRQVVIVDGVTLTIPEVRQMHADRLRVEFMAGMAPDLILNTYHHPVYQFAGGGHLADFYTLIDNCPVTSRDDFFMNVLEAHEFFGGVYALPVTFSPYSYVGINTNMPQHFVDRFAEFSHLTISDLVYMCLEILDEKDVIMHHGVSGLFQINPLLLNVGYFVDWNARTANFIQPELIELLGLSIEFSQRLRFSSGSFFSHGDNVIGSVGVFRRYAAEDMFHNFRGNLHDANMFFRRGDIGFDHFIPLADDNGRVILGDNAFGFDVWTPAGRNTDLAWEFTRYLIEAVSRSTVIVQGQTTFVGINSFRVPIKRTLFDQHMRRLLGRGDIRRALADYYTDEEFAIAREAAIARIYEISNMPMTLPDPMFPSRFITEPFEEYSLGIITATEALNRMQNAVRLWLIE